MDLRSIGSFKAKLRCLTGRCSGVVAVTAGQGEFVSAGWLFIDELGEGLEVPELGFQLIEHKGDRSHYHVTKDSPGSYQGAKLGVSRNGFLGFYERASVTDFWKLEVFGGSADGPYIYLRNSEGARVGYEVRKENVGGFAPLLKDRKFLTTEGSVVHFALEGIAAR